ncbi:unnamed protein product [marine sediment metagenome]|uniref:Uncharacterized protein n=1 Tax=marine sediment metagenome TaxID=412755 RepID=X1SV82_9ZZZZ
MNNIIILPEDGWKEISQEPQGLITLTAGGQHCVHTGQPSDSLIGHRYAKKPIKFTTIEGESIYVRVSRMCVAVGNVLGGGGPIEPPEPPLTNGFLSLGQPTLGTNTLG